MTTMKFRQLIDMAIGFPEPGHVNFSALHCLLTCIAEKLGIIDETINYINNEKESVCCCSKIQNCDLVQKSRLFAGSNPDEDISNKTQRESKEAVLQDTASVDIAPQQDIENSAINEQEVMASEIIDEAQEKDTKEQQIPQQNLEIEVLSPTISISSTKSASKSKLNERISKIELEMKNIAISKDISLGLAIMKNQLEFVIEQLLLLTFLTLSKKPDSQQIQILHSMAQTLHEIKQENIYIEGSHKIQLPIVPSLNWQSSCLQLNENISENDLLEAQSIHSPADTIDSKTFHHTELANHLCYSPEKMLDLLMEMKSEFCLLTNKVNEISSRLLQQESQRTLSLIREIQEQMRDTKQTTTNLKETQSLIEVRLTSNLSNIEIMKRNIEELVADKVDKTQLEIQLADKVDYSQLQRKVSLDQMLELQCRIDKKFCEMLRQISDNEKKFSLTIDDLKTTLGFAAIDGILKTFKENITKDIQGLHELLKNYMESTNDDCAAAGTRIKVLQNLACLSCDNDCVMRTMEKANVAKLPNAHSSNILSPLITYELGSIRKSGIMGYYRKDEFPHSTNAWLARQSNTLNDSKRCVLRHAGGEHTTCNARERTEKMSNRK